MALVKVSAVLYLRELIHAKGEEVANGFWKTFSPEDRKYFQTLLPLHKIPIEKVTNFFELAVPLLFPDRTLVEGLWQFGYQNAQYDMKGLYRVLLKIASVEMVVKNAAMIWKTYHEKGQASVQRPKANQLLFVVEKYPEIPKSFREQLTGYINGLISLTGAKNVKVVRDDIDPNAWKWLINVG